MTTYKPLTLEEIEEMERLATTPSAPGDWYVADVPGFLRICRMARASLEPKFSRKDELAAKIQGYMDAMRPLLEEWSELK